MTAILPADWPAPPSVVAFTTLRHGAGVSQAPFDSFNLGARCGDDAAAVAANRRELETRFGLPSAPRWLRQVHGTTVVRFEASTPSPPEGGEGWGGVSAFEYAASPKGTPPQPSPAFAGEGASAFAGEGAEPEADAAVTSAPDVVLAILTADCLPVVFAADDGSEVAAAHAGWRGLAAGVLENTVAAMRTPADRIVAWLGPAAGPQAYEVGEEVFMAFVSRDARARSAFVATRPGHWHVDLYALARQRLADAGVQRVHGGGLCTISDPQRFHSHRRDQHGGRMATLVWRNSADDGTVIA